MRQLADRFLAALRHCTGPQSIKKRLVTAWVNELDHVSEDDIPQTLRSDFAMLRDAMYAEKPLPTENGPTASVRKMSSNQAAQHAATILRISTELLRVHYNSSLIEVAGQEPLFEPAPKQDRRLN